MKCSIISAAAIMALLPALGAAGPIKRQTVVTANDLATAVNAWQADTSAVSNFLNIASTITDETAFIAAAQSALDSENNELVHKATIDTIFLNVDNPNADISTANNVLVGEQTFSNVVLQLQNLVDGGIAALGDVDIINGNRCTSVLPAIDMYFSVVENSLTVAPEGLSIAVPTGGAVRPTACNLSGVN